MICLSATSRCVINFTSSPTTWNTPPELEETDSYLHATDFARAWMLGIIPTEEVYRE